MTCKVYKSESAKMSENRGSLRFVENKIKQKLVNFILASANHCPYKGFFWLRLIGSNRMFANLGNIIYKTEQSVIYIQISSLKKGTNLTKDFIINKVEESMKKHLMKNAMN